MKKAVAEMSKLKMLIKLFDVRHDPLDLLNEFRKGKEARILGGSPAFLFRHEGGLQVLNQLERLDDAFRDLHQYKPEEYFTEGSYCLANRKSAARRSRHDVELIKDELRNKYLKAGHGKKGEIKKGISNKYDVSESGLDALIKQLKVEDQH